jgi:hypothetical protein
VLGIAPVALVWQFFNVLPNRTVVRWDLFGNTTIIGTRPMTIFTVAIAGALIAILSVLIGLAQHRSLVALGLRRAYLTLNLAQVVAIALTCVMIVSEALGYQFKIKPMIPPAMAVLMFSAGVLCWRLDAEKPGLLRLFGGALLVGAVGLLAFSAIAMNAVVGYYASAFAVLAMAAVALPQTTR